MFINCPFDDDYWPLFEAIVFTVVAAGFRPLSALEELDSGRVRLSKIQDMIRKSRYGIHDLSRVDLGSSTGLPRFNMPFELGLDIASSVFGPPTLKQKRFLILDSEPYRYQKFISDISGQDLQCHHGEPDSAVVITRNWLRSVSRRSNIPGPLKIQQRYTGFVKWLPAFCVENGFDRDELLFIEYIEAAQEWIQHRFDEADLRREPLTNLSNRATILQELQRVITRARRGGPPHAVLMIDVDGLRQINEELGHLVGDIVLREVAAVLDRVARGAAVGRWGGDEFILVAPAATAEQAVRLAEGIQLDIGAEPLFAHGDRSVRTTVSIGIVMSGQAAPDSPETVITAAHEALQHAKRAGPNGVHILDRSAE